MLCGYTINSTTLTLQCFVDILLTVQPYNYNALWVYSKQYKYNLLITMFCGYTLNSTSINLTLQCSVGILLSVQV